MEQFVIRLPEPIASKVTIPDGAKRAIVLNDLPEKVLATIVSGGRYRIALADGRETTATIVVSGLTATAFLDGDMGLQITLSCGDMVRTANMTSMPTIGIDFDTGDGFVARMYLRNESSLSLEMDANVVVYRYVGTHANAVSLGFESGTMAVVRLSVIADWSDYMMSALQNKTMQDMAYTEV